MISWQIAARGLFREFSVRIIDPVDNLITVEPGTLYYEGSVSLYKVRSTSPLSHLSRPGVTTELSDKGGNVGVPLHNRCHANRR